MKQSLSVLVLLVALMISACGRDNGASAPPPQNQPIATYPQDPNVGVDQGGIGYGGFCGILCRIRLRIIQRRQQGCGW